MVQNEQYANNTDFSLFSNKSDSRNESAHKIISVMVSGISDLEKIVKPIRHSMNELTKFVD